jgi:hypothetical protein
MTIPKYVKEIMWRSEYCYIFPKSKAVDCSPGYTVTVKKATPYTNISTFRKELERLKRWVERQNGGSMEIIFCPSVTHHNDQRAIITIWDPVMKYIEQYIPKKQRNDI